MLVMIDEERDVIVELGVKVGRRCLTAGYIDLEGLGSGLHTLYTVLRYGGTTIIVTSDTNASTKPHHNSDNPSFLRTLHV